MPLGRHFALILFASWLLVATSSARAQSAVQQPGKQSNLPNFVIIFADDKPRPSA
jgi:hypothetical protein